MRHFGERWRRFPAGVGVCLLLCGLSGCFHHKKPPQPVVLPAPTPVTLETPATPAKVPMVETPKQKLPDVPVALAATKPKKPRRRPKVAPQGVATGAQTSGGAGSQAGSSGSGFGAGLAGATQVASAEPPAAEAGIGALGALTPGGGDQSPRARQEAADLIAATEKRMNALPKETVKAQGAQINKVRNFLREAQSALRSGDAEGARTLAMKAKLLLDDVEKAGGG